MMFVTDELVNDVMREMGVDVKKKKPPHWVQHYYISKASPPIGGKRPDGYICSRCGKKSWSKSESCDGCNSVMVNSDKIISDLQKVEDYAEVKHGHWKHCEQPLGWQDVDVAVCSVCGEEWVLDEWDIEEFSHWNKFCSSCGAKMDGRKDDK